MEQERRPEVTVAPQSDLDCALMPNHNETVLSFSWSNHNETVL